MNPLKRIIVTLNASLDQFVDQIENHEALTESAIEEIQKSAGNARMQFRRVQLGLEHTPRRLRQQPDDPLGPFWQGRQPLGQVRVAIRQIARARLPDARGESRVRDVHHLVAPRDQFAHERQRRIDVAVQRETQKEGLGHGCSPVLYDYPAMASLIEAIDIKRKMFFEHEGAPYHCIDVAVSRPTASIRFL